MRDFQLNKNFNGEVKITLENKKLKGLLTVSKFDMFTKTKITGVEYTLFNESGEPLKTLVTDKHGVAKFGNLDLGTYYLAETKAIEGYALNSKKVKVEITEDNLIHNEVFYNRKQELPITGLNKATLYTYFIGSLMALALFFNKKTKKSKNG